MKKNIRISIFVGIIIIVSILAKTSLSINFSKNPEIRELQKEAINHQIFEKIRMIRFNAVELFGFDWLGGYRDEVFIENGVAFSGHNGEYVIEMNGLYVEWDDFRSLKISYHGEKVYEAHMKFREWWGTGDNSLKEIKAFKEGEWINVFNEMVVQAMKGIPQPGINELEDNWGLNK